MPFYLIPGDLLLLSPLYLFSPDDLHQHGGHRQQRRPDSVAGGMGNAASGASSSCSGANSGATFYGYGFENTTIVPSATPGGDPRVVDFKSIHFDLPILEYRPYRAFDTQQSSAVLIQLFAGADVPQSSKVTWPPGAPGVKLETIYSIGLRLIFDWRRYF